MLGYMEEIRDEKVQRLLRQIQGNNRAVKNTITQYPLYFVVSISTHFLLNPTLMNLNLYH